MHFFIVKYTQQNLPLWPSSGAQPGHPAHSQLCSIHTAWLWNFPSLHTEPLSPLNTSPQPIPGLGPSVPRASHRWEHALFFLLCQLVSQVSASGSPQAAAGAARPSFLRLHHTPCADGPRVPHRHLSVDTWVAPTSSLCDVCCCGRRRSVSEALLQS